MGPPGETATVWVLLGRRDLLRSGIVEALAAARELEPAARSWPPRDERGAPAVVLCRHPAREQLTALKRRLGGARAVVVADATREEARAAIAQGADGVLLEQDVPALVVPAVRAALAGLVVLSAALGPAVERPPLTPREKQVLALVVMGYSNREIAAQLVVTESTVKSHLFSAFRRLGVRTRSEAVALITDPARGLGSGILTISQD